MSGEPTKPSFKARAIGALVSARQEVTREIEYLAQTWPARVTFKEGEAREGVKQLQSEQYQKHYKNRDSLDSVIRDIDSALRTVADYE